MSTVIRLDGRAFKILWDNLGEEARLELTKSVVEEIGKKHIKSLINHPDVKSVLSNITAKAAKVMESEFFIQDGYSALYRAKLKEPIIDKIREHVRQTSSEIIRDTVKEETGRLWSELSKDITFVVEQQMRTRFLEELHKEVMGAIKRTVDSVGKNQNERKEAKNDYGN